MAAQKKIMKQSTVLRCGCSPRVIFCSQNVVWRDRPIPPEMGAPRVWRAMAAGQFASIKAKIDCSRNDFLPAVNQCCSQKVKLAPNKRMACRLIVSHLCLWMTFCGISTFSVLSGVHRKRLVAALTGPEPVSVLKAIRLRLPFRKRKQESDE